MKTMKANYQKPESRVLELEMESHIMDLASSSSGIEDGTTHGFDIRRRRSFFYNDEEEEEW